MLRTIRSYFQNVCIHILTDCFVTRV